MYLNVLICLLISIFSFYTAYYIFKRNKNNYIDLSYAAFWFFVSLTWLFVTLSLLLYKFGYLYFDILVNQYLIQTFVFAQITVGIYFVFGRISNNKTIPIIAFFVFVLISLLGLYFDYQPGSLYHNKSTYASVEYHISDKATIFFQIEFVIVMLGMGIDFVRSLFYWFKKNNLFEQKYFFASLCAIIYGVTGYFDQLGVTAAWIAVFFRLVIVFCAHIVFLAYSEEEMNTL